MKIAIIGAGIFGSTVAIALAQKGYQVDVFEKEADILQAASGINQYRLHRGYHYPRSLETALSSKDAEESFMREYGDAVIHDTDHYYCIAQDKSKISKDDFLSFCDKAGLEYKVDTLDFFCPATIQATLKVKEALIDPLRLREIVKEKFVQNNVTVRCNYMFTKEHIGLYDKAVNCSYAQINSIFEQDTDKQKTYQFELCEKPVLRLPIQFAKKSVVVLDGPFFCIDPYAHTDLHVMGNVVHAIHHTNTGTSPFIPREFTELLNKGIVKNPSITNISKFIDTAAFFIPELKNAQHIGSMYTIRTVLPRVDHTDERPTLVYKVSDNIINVFSGKIGNCVKAADEVVNIVAD